MSRTLATSALAALLLLGCAGGLTSAQRDFKKGRAGEAKEKLVALEAESVGWSERDRASYALYRGLAHLAVGDRALATVWLQKAKEAEATSPSPVFDADDQTRLRLALDAVAERDGTDP